MKPSVIPFTRLYQAAELSSPVIVPLSTSAICWMRSGADCCNQVKPAIRRVASHGREVRLAGRLYLHLT